MKIPLLNIYYLLSYAWDKLEESEKVDVSKNDFDDLINLLSRVLVSGSTYLLKRGLDRQYNTTVSPYRGVKGKLKLSESKQANTFSHGIAICEFDEFDYNTLHNQIVKFTLVKLLYTKGVDKKHKYQIKALVQRMDKVALMPITLIDFNRVRLHRNNSFYKFVLEVCKIVLENISLNEQDGSYQFSDFLRDDKKMAGLFEAFLRNFYQQHSDFDLVKSDSLYWNETAPNNQGAKLPKMETDISLSHAGRKIIMDAKYYKEALQGKLDKGTIRSNHLYQLYAYLKNDDSDNSFITEGILIYPTVLTELDEKYHIDNHPVKIATVNLNQDWRNIEKRLLEIIEL